MAFARVVWRGAASSHKGTVAKWYYGRSGISADLAAKVASACSRPLEWLLSGNGPHRPGATKPAAELKHELANEVKERVLKTLDVRWWMREILADIIDAADLLGALERLVREECESMAGTLLIRERIGRAIESLHETRPDVARKELQRAYASAQFTGRVFTWKWPDTFTPNAAPPAK
jgi:hypothetical protein